MNFVLQALAWADSHGLLTPAILAALTLLARALWATVRDPLAARWPRVVPILEDLGARLAAVLPDVLRALVPPRPPQPRETVPLGRSGEAGRASPAALALAAFVGLLGLIFVGLALQGCPRAREAVLDTQSPRVACAADTQRCHDGAPEVCSRAGRWWPAMPPHDDGSPRRCAAVCEVSPAGVAHCAPSQVVAP
ncbi:MAG: hypothetical protein JNK72_00440 [Myxococcales bacterium]|nr:hypothetical protein [Myxococcales bacterium]